MAVATGLSGGTPTVWDLLSQSGPLWSRRFVCRSAVRDPDGSCLWRTASVIASPCAESDLLDHRHAVFSRYRVSILSKFQSGSRTKRGRLHGRCDEAIKLLRRGSEGIAEWNRWRAAGGEFPTSAVQTSSGANLRQADLCGADLVHARLRGADLRHTKLRRSVLTGADLEGTDLEGADLEGARLHKANLRGANLTGANLHRADLREALIVGAIFDGADLSGADFSGAKLTDAERRAAERREVERRAAERREAERGEASSLPESHRRRIPPSLESFEDQPCLYRPEDVPMMVFPERNKSTPAEPPPPLLRHVPRLSFASRPNQLLKALIRHRALWLRRFIHARLTASDRVNCSVFAPASVVRPGWLIVQVFAHRPDQTEVVKGLAEELDNETQRRGFHSLELEIKRGTRLRVHLHVPGIDFDTPIQDIFWIGRPNYVAFTTLVPVERAIGNVVGTVTISRDGIPVGSIKYKNTKVDNRASPSTPKTLRGQPVVTSRRYSRAFISYASADRPEVLKRVQMLRLAHIRYFQDLLQLEPGDRWERKLYHHIDKCDLFLLFWSTKAKESRWVLDEVRYAPKRQGGDILAPPELIPVIIEGPPIPNPPDELSAHLHFNDYLLYFLIKAESLLR